jgi:hypothetical protein
MFVGATYLFPGRDWTFGLIAWAPTKKGRGSETVWRRKRHGGDVRLRLRGVHVPALSQRAEAVIGASVVEAMRRPVTTSEVGRVETSGFWAPAASRETARRDTTNAAKSGWGARIFDLIGLTCSFSSRAITVPSWEA